MTIEQYVVIIRTHERGNLYETALMSKSAAERHAKCLRDLAKEIKSGATIRVKRVIREYA